MVQPSINLDIFDDEVAGRRSHRGCGSCGSGEAGSRCGNGLEKIYPTTAVRFGYLKFIGEFTHAPDMKFTCGARVIIQTRRGLEMGEQVSLTCNGCDKSVTREQMKAWVDACGQESFLFDAGRIIREATAADLAEYAHIQSANREKRNFCQAVVNRFKLPMKIVECEAPFGGERLIFYFMAEERIDFRHVVKELATEYRTRIEMRQIGARDEARLLADYETCGREVCCKVFLKTLQPISMRMAKLQKATLDPSQVSGRCGRLKCCLRYEHVGYEELDRKLPKTGVRIRTNHGEGVIVNRQILTQLVQIKTDDEKLVTVVAEDIVAVGVPPPGPRAPGRDRASGADMDRPDRTTGSSPPRSRPEPGPPRRLPPREGTPTSKNESGADEAPDSAPADPARQEDRRRRRGRRRGRPPHSPPPSGGVSPSTE